MKDILCYFNRHIARSARGTSDPLQQPQSTDAVIISTNAMRFIPIVRQHLESMRPQSMDATCSKPNKLAIIVPYRDRATHRQQFIPYLSDYLSKQALNHTIYLVEQPAKQPFNGGLLKNIGAFVAHKYDHDFLCFHDIDLLPIDLRYDQLPNHPYRPFAKLERHGKAYQSSCPEGTFQATNFGGIVCFPTPLFFAANGYCHDYWGWGCEDDDLLIRAFLQGQIPMYHPHHCIRNLEHLHATKHPNWVKGWVYHHLMRRNQARVRRFRRGIPMRSTDLSTIDESSYTLTDGGTYQSVQAHTDRFIAASPSYPRCYSQPFFHLF